MEITLEKIELVKDRTGVSYKEAKEALEAAEGNVVDAIISIEETINMTGQSKLSEQGSKLVENVKELVKRGNVSRIVITKDEDTVLNLPVNVGILGTVLAPWVVVAGTIAAFGTKCKIELFKEDGTVVNVTDKAADTFGTVVDKGSDLAGDLKEKGADAVDSIKDTLGKSKRNARANADDFKDSVDEMWEEAKTRVKEAKSEASDESDVIEEDVIEEDVIETATDAEETSADVEETIVDAEEVPVDSEEEADRS